ncbi:hypothetical protein [Paenibacillus sp. MMO-58]|uniref:hypothetical protein n=1 Tax=Paenibacillus sp. MMO-58 TaxID=3081290 RepID=UPI0030163A69
MNLFSKKDEREKIMPLINFQSGVIPAPLKVDERIEAKLQYLDTLNQMHHNNILDSAELEDRLERLCDSIEKELGIKKNDSTITIKCPLCGKPALITNVKAAHSKTEVEAYCSDCDCNTDVIYQPGKQQPAVGGYYTGGIIKP